MWPWKKRSLQDVVQAIERLTAHINALDAELQDLKDKHVSLRGRVYNAGLHRSPLKDSEQDRVNQLPMSRDELRKMSGFIPGRPFPHKEG